VVGSGFEWVANKDISDLEPIDADIVRAHIEYMNKHNITDIDEYPWSSDEVLGSIEDRLYDTYGDEAYDHAELQGYRKSWAGSNLWHYIDWSSEWTPDYVEKVRK